MSLRFVAALAVIVALCALFLPPIFLQPDFWSQVVDLTGLTQTHFIVIGVCTTTLILLTCAAFAPPKGEQPWQKDERHAEITTLVVISITIAFFFFVYDYLQQMAGDTTKRPDLVAILATGATATIAILLQIFLENRRQRRERHEAERLRRRDFTHRAIQEFRTDQEVQKHRLNLRHEFPDLEVIAPERVPQLYISQFDPGSYEQQGAAAIKEPVLDSIKSLLAFYEQLAADIRDDVDKSGFVGSVDEDLLTNTMAPVIENLFQKALAYIHLMWRFDPEAYEHLRWLINRWGLRKADADHQVAYAVVGWSKTVWTEYGNERRLLHGTEGNGCWGRRALMEAALQGLESLDSERPADRLATKIKDTWGAEATFEEDCARILGRTLDDWLRARHEQRSLSITILTV